MAKKDDNQQDEQQDNTEQFGADFLFYKSSVAGLGVALPAEDPEDRSELHREVRFVPYEVFDEKTGEHYRVGYLATDDPDAQELLSEDLNVEQIDEEQYKEATEKYKRVG